MKYQNSVACVLLIIVSMLTLAASGAEQAEPTKLGNNAALKYWKGFAMLPSLDGDDRKLLSRPTESPVNESAREIVKNGGFSLGFMHKGVSMAECDWGNDMTEGPRLLLPHCSKARELARLAVLRSRVRFADGNAKGANDDLMATLRFARHVGDHGTTLIETLVDYAMRNIAIDAAAANLVALTPTQREQLAAVLKEIQPATESGEMVRREKAGNLTYIERTLREGGFQGLVEGLGGEAPRFTEGEREIVVALHKLLNDPQNQAIVINSLNAHYDQMIKDAASPYAEAVRKLKAYGQEVKQKKRKLDEFQKSKKLPDDPKDAMALVADGLWVNFVPALDRFKTVEASVTIRHAMLTAAIAYANKGGDAAAKVADPITGKPLKITPVEGKPGWIELASTLTRDGQPVTLRVRID